MATYITRQGQTVDLVCLDVYGRTTTVVELVLAANPSLAAFGPLLPLGTLIELPELPPPAREQRSLTKLWD